MPIIKIHLAKIIKNNKNKNKYYKNHTINKYKYLKYNNYTKTIMHNNWSLTNNFILVRKKEKTSLHNHKKNIITLNNIKIAIIVWDMIYNKEMIMIITKLFWWN